MVSICCYDDRPGQAWLSATGPQSQALSYRPCKVLAARGCRRCNRCLPADRLLDPPAKRHTLVLRTVMYWGWSVISTWLKGTPM